MSIQKNHVVYYQCFSVTKALRNSIIKDIHLHCPRHMLSPWYTQQNTWITKIITFAKAPSTKTRTRNMENFWAKCQAPCNVKRYKTFVKSYITWLFSFLLILSCKIPPSFKFKLVFSLFLFLLHIREWLILRAFS